MSKYLADRLDRDTKYLQATFPNVKHMDGIIIVLDGKKGYDSYTSILGDPMQEDTLIIEDNNGRIMLFFSYSTCPVASNNNNITVIKTFSYTTGCLIHKKRKPAELPNYLKVHVLQPSIEDLNVDETFFTKNYSRGGIVPIKDVRKHPEWKNEYESMVEIKRVHVCKSCRNKAHIGCCKNYSTSNRVMVRVIVGWS